MDVSLLMVKSDGSQAAFPLKRERTVIGRTNSCDLRIPVGSVSREHCEILVNGESVTIRDLGSSNGTFVNDTRVQEAKVGAGDVIVVGPVRFTVDTGVARQPAGEPVIEQIDAPAAAPDDEMLSLGDSAESDDMMTVVDAGDQPASPAHDATVDMDDPIAALEALADLDDDLKLLPEDDQKSS